MKFLHVSDIHLGKRLHGRSLSEDHDFILGQILSMAARPDCDAVLIAGDVYNRAQPLPESIAAPLQAPYADCFIAEREQIARGNFLRLLEQVLGA